LSQGTQVARRFRESIDRFVAALPKDVRYCARCVVSNQRPRITFDERGVCSACRYAEEKKLKIDWAARRARLLELCDRHRRTDGRYDCIVPCSGGKDSAAVAWKLKQVYGMHPLTVTWAPHLYTPIGRQNYDAFLRSGFANVMAHGDGRLVRKLARIGFEAVGDIFLPFCFGQMTYPFHVAVEQDVRLVFYGENGEAEYGGSSADNDRPGRSVETFAEYYFKGVTVDEALAWGFERGVLAPSDVDPCDLRYFRPPELARLQEKKVEMHWFSYYEKWVPQENYYVAAEHTGFQPNPDGRSEGTYSKYASLDDKLDGLHYYLAFIKFGIGRATSDAAHEIRDGHLTREEGVALVRKFDAEFPRKHLAEVLDFIEMDEPAMWRVIDSYRPPHLWERTGDGWNLKVQVS
jgi:N-acetyl sugar amidotransferase